MSKKKRSRLPRFLLVIVGLFFIWLLAFLVWLFWSDIEGVVNSRGAKRSSEQSRKPSQERIFEEERKKLDEIIKER